VLASFLLCSRNHRQPQRIWKRELLFHQTVQSSAMWSVQSKSKWSSMDKICGLMLWLRMFLIPIRKRNSTKSSKKHMKIRMITCYLYATKNMANVRVMASLTSYILFTWLTFTQPTMEKLGSKTWRVGVLLNCAMLLKRRGIAISHGWIARRFSIALILELKESKKANTNVKYVVKNHKENQDLKSKKLDLFHKKKS
jgi:hypothetical protein